VYGFQFKEGRLQRCELGPVTLPPSPWTYERICELGAHSLQTVELQQGSVSVEVWRVVDKGGSWEFLCRTALGLHEQWVCVDDFLELAGYLRYLAPLLDTSERTVQVQVHHPDVQRAFQARQTGNRRPLPGGEQG